MTERPLAATHPLTFMAERHPQVAHEGLAEARGVDGRQLVGGVVAAVEDHEAGRRKAQQVAGRRLADLLDAGVRGQS